MWFNKIVDYNPITKILEKIFSKSKFLSDMVNYFCELFCKGCPKNLSNILFATGVASVTFSTLLFIYKQYNLWKWVPSHFSNRKTVNKTYLNERYGKGHVVITGCTDGIGLAFAQVLAPMYDLILVARNKEKLDLRINELKQKNPDTNIIPIIADLSNMEGINKTVRELRDLILKKVDISIVINNAGMAAGGSFFDLDASGIIPIATCNFTAIHAINRQLIPYLRRRNHRGAIINLSSCTGYFFSPFTGIYSSTKHLIDIYTRTLIAQNNHKIDILSSRPFGVTTPMMKMKKGPFMISPTDCAISTLADLGKTESTWTGFRHKLAGVAFSTKSQRQVMDYYAMAWKKR